jgi:hypothetical protein
MDNAGLGELGMTVGELLHWYFLHLGGPVGSALSQAARAQGFPNTGAFLRAIFREYRDSRLQSNGAG